MCCGCRNIRFSTEMLHSPWVEFGVSDSFDFFLSLTEHSGQNKIVSDKVAMSKLKSSSRNPAVSLPAALE